MLNQIFAAKDEMARVVTSDVDAIIPGFRMIYQSANDENLYKFDIMTKIQMLLFWKRLKLV